MSSNPVEIGRYSTIVESWIVFWIGTVEKMSASVLGKRFIEFEMYIMKRMGTQLPLLISFLLLSLLTVCA